MERHFGMDWLRIGAFAILILYHVGMVFTPWDFHVKTADPVEWLSAAMLISNPWRLMLLFVVSGYASRALFAKSSGGRGGVTSRTVRLLISLAAGVVVMVPPQTWVELVTQHGYGQDFGSFLLFDYISFTTIDGVGVPTWNHLWFVGYLWTYSAVRALALRIPRPRILQHWFDRALGGWRALGLPAVYLVLTQVVIFHRWSDSQDLIRDGVAGRGVETGGGAGGRLLRVRREPRIALPGQSLPAGLAEQSDAGGAPVADLVGSRRVDRDRRALSQPRCRDPADADRSRIPVLPDPSDGDRAGRILAAAARPWRGRRILRPRRGDGGRLLGLLSDRARGELAEAADRIAAARAAR